MRGRGTFAPQLALSALSALSQRRQQVPQTVVVDLVHQRELPANFAARKPFARQPVEVRPGQVGNQPALVFPERHDDGDELFEVWILHAGIVHGFWVPSLTLREGFSEPPAPLFSPARLEFPPLHTMEGIMMSVYVVKTGEQFLCTAEDGDIGMAPAVEDATSFGSYEEAEKAAHVHADPGYEIVAVCVIRH
jgi:hypothetical protein